MFKVYWTDSTNTPQGLFVNTLNRALSLAEEKRKEGYTFVTMVSENPDNVTKMGVADVDENYDWQKRRM